MGEPAWCAERQIDGGGYGQYTVTGERQCLKLPSTISLEDGALVEPMAVGLHGVAVSGFQPGERVLVIGVGPIGLASIFWARRHGAGPIVATAKSRRREALAMEMGASAFVPPADDLGAEVNKALGGPPDVIFECVGAPGILAQAIGMVRPRGTVVLMGLCWGLDSLVPAITVAKEVRIQPAAFYSKREFQVSIDAFEADNVEPRSMITDRISLAQLPDAFEALRQRTTQCKVMVDSWAE
jgi:(R,R)-butanediol dehydrogenase/meso-butanediol dehydrogenase/diacetyl reductase